jgi:subtilisin family serine protease
MRRSPEAGLVALAAAVATVLALAGGGPGAATPRVDAERWGDAVGGERTPVSVGQRMIVLLKTPSLAERVARAGGRATEQQMRRWNAAVVASQKELAARVAAEGVPLVPEHVFTRTVNGFSVPLEARGLAVLERDPDVAGIYPVRAAYPASVARAALRQPAFGAGSGHRVDVSLAGFDGGGVTVALLDTGIDLGHPFVHHALLPGIDLVTPEGTAATRPKPTERGRPERHATELAGLVAGRFGPAGLRGVAPGASLLPIRVAGWQRDAEGGWTVYARTDQLLAGLERAVDPDGNGDTHDAARVALVGVAEPFAAFADGPLARAIEGAAQLDTLVVVPAGNDGPAAPSFGSLAGPAGAPAALTVGATDARPSTPVVRVVLRAGLRVLHDGVLPLGGAVSPQRPVTVPLALPRPRRRDVQERLLARFFDARGFSRVAGRAALLSDDERAQEAQRDAALAGAAAIVVDGVLPGGALGLDDQVPVPVVGLPSAVVAAARRELAAGRTVTLSLGAAGAVPHEPNAPAGFSSRGLSFGAWPKPEVAAPGVGLATSTTGLNPDRTARYGTVSGTSAAAAVVAGAAALLAQARPALDARALRGLLVGTAKPVSPQPGAPALLDLAAAAAAEVVAEPATVSFGALSTAGTTHVRTVRLRNVSTRRLDVRVETDVEGLGGIAVTASPVRIALPPGRAVSVRLTARAAFLPRALEAATGRIRIVPRGGVGIGIPWAAALPPRDARLLEEVRLSARSFRPSDTAPAVLSFQAGSVRISDRRPQVTPVELLEIELHRGARRLGVLARLRDLLPGRYAFGLTGRGPRGARLARGAYTLRIVAYPVAGGAPVRRDIRFTIR